MRTVIVKLAQMELENESSKDPWLAVNLEEEDIVAIRKNGGIVYDPDMAEEEKNKKTFAFLIAPVLSVLPSTAVIIGTATLGVVGGVASGVGSRIADVIWPKK